MKAKVDIEAGVCGFHTTASVSSQDDQNVTFTVDTDCDKIRQLGGTLQDKGCQVLLCGGMGWRAAEDLKAKGITPLMVEPNLKPEEAVGQFMAGTLQPGGGFCRCHG